MLSRAAEEVAPQGMPYFLTSFLWFFLWRTKKEWQIKKRYLTSRPYLHAAKGEISKIDTTFIKGIIIQSVINPQKIVKEIIPALHASFDQRKIGYLFVLNSDVLKNANTFKQYQEDVVFKKLLAKAKQYMMSTLQSMEIWWWNKIIYIANNFHGGYGWLRMLHFDNIPFRLMVNYKTIYQRSATNQNEY